MNSIPAQLIAGDTWAWSREFADYPAPTWVATVYFENAAGSFSAAATASGSDHAFSIDAATTGGKAAGRYKWSVRVASGSEAYTVESGWVDVLTNPAAAGNRDPRSWARRALDAVEAAIESRATSDQLSFSIRDRSVARHTLVELRQLRTELRQEVRTEERGEAAGLGRNIKTRFSR